MPEKPHANMAAAKSETKPAPEPKPVLPTPAKPFYPLGEGSEPEQV